MKHFLLFILILVHLPGYSQQQTEQELRTLMEELHVIGLSVVAVKNGEIVYKNNLGWQDVEKQTPLNEQSIFRIASISKSFSATAIMQLVDQKKLSLNDDFSKLVGFPVRNPRYPDKTITLKMVLSHTSSINDRNGYFNLDAINPEKNTNWANSYNDYAPGTRYYYCNLNYNMTGAAIERLTGERFDTRIRKHILNPLNLYGGYNIDSLDSQRFATLYEYDSARGQFVASPQAYASRAEALKNYTLGYSTPVFSPTGGMKISAEDLAKYMIMHMNDGKYNGVKVLSKKSAKLMRKPVLEQSGYGLAISTTKDLIAGKILNGHTGSAYGLYSAMFYHPAEKFGFVVITNGCLPYQSPDIRMVLRKSIVILYNNIISPSEKQGISKR